MTQVSQLSPELARGLLQLSRALMVAVRNWTLYPPDHPAVGASVTRLAESIRESSFGAVFAIGVTPETLLVEGSAADSSQIGIAEAAALLHDRDLLQIAFLGDVPTEAVHALLRVLTFDADERRRRGGPATIWQTDGHPSLALTQIDYEAVLARESRVVPESARRDDLWRSIVMTISGGANAVFDERAQARLLAIAGSPADIGDLATAVMAPMCAPDGSPMVSSQAAAVLAAFRHLTSVVTVLAPERATEVMENIATAAVNLDAHVVMEMLQSAEDPATGVSVVRGLVGALDDMKVAQLMATALSLDGKATERLATIFDSIVPDEDRKQRVLKLTRTLLRESDFGQSKQFQPMWKSVEELLFSYNDKPFVSEVYRGALDAAGGRAETMAVIDLPPEVTEWLASLGQDNVRLLSVQLLIDLLAIETDLTRASEVAGDMGLLAEDLLMSGAYDEAQKVTDALGARGQSTNPIGRDACREALDKLGDSAAMRETAALIGDVDAADWARIHSIVITIGVSSIEALKPLVMVEHETLASKRAEDTIVEFGRAAVASLGSMVGDSPWFVQKNGARILGRIGAPEAVPLLQPLLRKPDPRVARQAVVALSRISDPSAARAIHTVLRASGGALRRAVIAALVSDRDPRVVPVLVRIIVESRPLGRDHHVVLETLAALGTVGADAGVTVIAATIRRRAFLRRRRLRALKQKGVRALVQIGTPAAAAAIADAARTGDRLLRKIIARGQA